MQREEVSAGTLALTSLINVGTLGNFFFFFRFNKFFKISWTYLKQELNQVFWAKLEKKSYFPIKAQCNSEIQACLI